MSLFRNQSASRHSTERATSHTFTPPANHTLTLPAPHLHQPCPVPTVAHTPAYGLQHPLRRLPAELSACQRNTVVAHTSTTQRHMTAHGCTTVSRWSKPGGNLREKPGVRPATPTNKPPLFCRSGSAGLSDMSASVLLTDCSGELQCGTTNRQAGRQLEHS